MNRRQRGFTLIELMVALAVSSLLVGMILAIFSRMSMAYRGQQQVAGVQQLIAAARAAIEFDAKQAGLGMPQGFAARVTGTQVQSPVQIANNNAGPDELALFYADLSFQALVTDASAWPAGVTLDADPGFAAGDRVVVTSVDVSQATAGVTGANIAQYTACVVEIGSVSAGPPVTVTFATDPPWGLDPGTPHCAAPVMPGAMVYKFVSHAYKIDPARPALGPLQRSLTGGLLGANEVYEDLAFGFTDLQTALRVYEHQDLVDADGDGDPAREWYSGGEQDNRTAPGIVTHPSGFLQISISLVARTDQAVEGIATAATPNLSGADPDHNSVGDHPSETLPWAADPTVPGFIYRHTTFRVDFRNLGVGR